MHFFLGLRQNLLHDSIPPLHAAILAGGRFISGFHAAVRQHSLVLFFRACLGTCGRSQPRLGAPGRARVLGRARARPGEPGSPEPNLEIPNPSLVCSKVGLCYFNVF